MALTAGKGKASGSGKASGNGKVREMARPEKWQGPCMYEMQGPCLAFGCWARRLPGWLAVTRPAAGTGRPPEVPVSRFFLRSGVAPGVVPVSGSDVFLLP
jgi:hypothetical protein